MADTAALDAWIAEHLLGWGRVSAIFAKDKDPGWRDPHDANRPRTCRGLSTTGDGMLMVLEAMRERMPGVRAAFQRELRPLIINNDGFHWERDWSIWITPLAVAQAARAALEAE